MRPPLARLWGLAAALLIVVAAAAPAVAAENVRLRFAWWGNPDRDRRTDAVIEVYEKSHPGVQIDGESLGWTGYWPKLATQAAGGNLPDIVVMDYRYLYEYTRRGLLRPLDGSIELPDFEPDILSAGTVDGKLYAVSLGTSGWALYYNKPLLARLGLGEPVFGWSWDDFETLAGAVAEAEPGRFYGAEDLGGEEPALEIWLLQQGKALYAVDGGLGFDAGDIERYFGFWDGLRRRGLVPPASMTAAAAGNALTDDPLVRGEVAVSFAGINQLVGLQSLTEDEIGMTSLPTRPGGKPGVYRKPSSFATIPTSSRHPEAAAAFIQWLVTDPEAASILGIERGVPGSAAANRQIEGELDREGRKMVAYMKALSGSAAELPAPPPSGAGEIDKLLQDTYQQVAFEQLTPAEAAAMFVEQAKAALARSH